jgi:cytoskeletal protein CcmA (bactofilin family)
MDDAPISQGWRRSAARMPKPQSDAEMNHETGQIPCAIRPRTTARMSIVGLQKPTGIGKERIMSNQNPHQGQATTPELTVIGADTRIKGEMFFEKSARILGHFEGKITAQGEVQIGNGANCNAAVEAEQIIVDGSVQGPLFARDRLTLTKNAQVQGDLTAGTLVVSEGASFVGHCNVGPRAQEMTGQSNQNLNNASSTAEPKNIATPLDLTPPWAQDSNPSVA